MDKKYIITIGLEIHVALQSKQKLFSQTMADFEVKEFSLFDCAIPGVLPILNYEPVFMACAFGLSTQAQVKKHSIFERKHYFYPDLAPGYQITQQYNPIIVGGQVPIVVDGKTLMVEIEHAHLECDASKSIHDDYLGVTKIDISRGTSPLLEIVSTPCMHSSLEAKEYAKAVHSLVSFLGICDGKMQEGSFRVDASISLHTEPGKLGTRVEIKNISSFSFLEQALEYEYERQSSLLDKGQAVLMETRLYDEESGQTRSMREKETVGEYRYMPDPDIPHLILTQEDLDRVEQTYYFKFFQLQNFLKEKISTLNLGVSPEQLSSILFDKYMQKYMIDCFERNIDSYEIYKFIFFTLQDLHKKSTLIKYISLTDIQTMLSWGLGAKETRQALEEFLINGKSLLDCKPVFEDDSVVDKMILEVLAQYPQEIEKYKNGQEKILQFIIGKCMGQLKGKAPASVVKDKVLSLI